MAYTVFARKYRPQTFDELVGQEHVARTLGNAIRSDRVAHAFLFTGVRGVGKTTTARLLAKALNCETGPTPTPCNTCQICLDITAGVDMDVQEIDGASNNSVDDVRRLQESLPYRPSRDRSKIVIVDEVHMLSTGAFNAFLKTLEEPPPHVKFIFATTESHKVPVTIRSRCQRYDFRLIPQAVVAERVRAILSAEGVKADDDAVALVAREAAGSMRDALTLLDQLVAFGGAELVGEEVARHLGIAGRALLHGALHATLSGDAHAVLRAVDDAATRGADPIHFVRQLVQTLRDLVVLRVGGDDRGLVDLVDEEREATRALAETVELPELQRVFSIVAKLVDEVAKASSPRLVLEMGLVRAATRPALRDVGELLARLERLERHVTSGGGGGGGSRPTSATGPTGRAPQAPEPPRTRSAADVRAEARAAGTIPPWEALARDAMARDGGGRPRESRPRPSGDPRSDDESPPDAAIAIEPSPASRAPSVTPAVTPAVAPAVAPGADASHEPTPNGSTSHPSTAPGARVLRPALQEWEALIASLREAKPALAAVLEHGVPRIVSAERIVLSFQHGSFYGRQADAPAAKDAIAEAAARRLGGRPAIEVRFDAAADAKGRTVAAIEATRRDAERTAKRRQALNHPAVLDAIEVFPEARGHLEVRLEGD
ncbi:MAG: DNA polymerase III subunit gamma/tau [Myxococcales bacterium]|nr:DNA polymerase III subunit gamma/tau [Myxococcales bacterium]